MPFGYSQTCPLLIRSGSLKEPIRMKYSGYRTTSATPTNIRVLAQSKMRSALLLLQVSRSIPPYHKLACSVLLATVFTMTRRRKLISELNSPMAAE